MEFIRNFDLASFLDTFASLGFAFVLGTLIGAERQYRQRTAGLRTNVLVALSAAAFVDVAMRINGVEGAARVISYVVSGIGFLGAGVIMKEGLNAAVSTPPRRSGPRPRSGRAPASTWRPRRC